MHVSLAFSLTPTLTFFVWGGLAVMSWWSRKDAKVAATLMTLLGALFLAVASFCSGFGIDFPDGHWLPFLGAGLVTLGFYLTVKPIVDARLKEIQAKRQAAGPPRPPQA